MSADVTAALREEGAEYGMDSDHVLSDYIVVAAWVDLTDGNNTKYTLHHMSDDYASPVHCAMGLLEMGRTLIEPFETED